MSENTESPMDYAEHDRTFDSFMDFTKIGTIACLNVVVLLALFGFGGGFGVFMGWVLLVALLVAFALGMMLKSNKWVPSAVVMVLSMLVGILALS